MDSQTDMFEMIRGSSNEWIDVVDEFGMPTPIQVVVTACIPHRRAEELRRPDAALGLAPATQCHSRRGAIVRVRKCILQVRIVAVHIRKAVFHHHSNLQIGPVLFQEPDGRSAQHTVTQ